MVSVRGEDLVVWRPSRYIRGNGPSCQRVKVPFTDLFDVHTVGLQSVFFQRFFPGVWGQSCTVTVYPGRVYKEKHVSAIVFSRSWVKVYPRRATALCLWVFCVLVCGCARVGRP